MGSQSGQQPSPGKQCGCKLRTQSHATQPLRAVVQASSMCKTCKETRTRLQQPGGPQPRQWRPVTGQCRPPPGPCCPGRLYLFPARSPGPASAQYPNARVSLQHITTSMMKQNRIRCQFKWSAYTEVNCTKEKKACCVKLMCSDQHSQQCSNHR